MLNDNGPTHVDSFSHLDPDPTRTNHRPDAPGSVLRAGDLSRRIPGARADRHHRRPPRRNAARSGLQLNRGDLCFFYTATYDKYAGTDEYLTNFAGLGESAADWIVDKGIKAFGVDSPTPDNPTSTIYPVHMMGRREHITHYENLVLTEVVGKRFTFVGFPLKVVGAHGGPTRAVAIVEE